MPPCVAFVCAMPMELTPLRKKLSLERTRAGALDVYRGILNDKPVVAIVTGMGTELATQGLERLLESVEVEQVVVVGISGAVENETPLGTLVLPEVVVNGATGAEYRPHLVGNAETPGGELRGNLWTTDSLITDPGVIAQLRERGVVSLDMETAAIAEVCDRRGIPWSVFRVLSDRATDGIVDEEVFHLSHQDGTPNTKAVAAYFLKHPGRVPAMARMARMASLATNRAAEEAIRALS